MPPLPELVLLVEDNQDDAALMLRALKRNNVHNSVVVARDGIEALDFLFARNAFSDRAGELPPKLVVLDLKLPRLDGLGVLTAIRACWESLYGDRAISYRASQGLAEEPAIAVVVQRLVSSERSGVMFTADPMTSNRQLIVIEGAFGLGEVVVSGAVEPDTYVVAKRGPTLQSVRIGHKTHELVPNGHGGIDRPVVTVHPAG